MNISVSCCRNAALSCLRWANLLKMLRARGISIEPRIEWVCL